MVYNKYDKSDIILKGGNENEQFQRFQEVTEKLDAIDFNPYKKIGKEWFLVTAGDESGWTQ